MKINSISKIPNEFIINTSNVNSCKKFSTVLRWSAKSPEERFRSALSAEHRAIRDRPLCTVEKTDGRVVEAHEESTSVMVYPSTACSPLPPAVRSQRLGSRATCYVPSCRRLFPDAPVSFVLSRLSLSLPLPISIISRSVRPTFLSAFRARYNSQSYCKSIKACENKTFAARSLTTHRQLAGP